MSRVRKNKIRKKSPVFVLFAAAAVIVLALVGGVAAKYMYTNSGDNILSAKNFYFDSNLLVKGGKEYTINSTATEIPIMLYNYQDSLKYADDDITYTISVEGEGGSLDKTSGTLAKGGVSSDTVILSGITSGKTYTVTATGTAGYTKTISATFKVSDADENVYKHLDTSNPAYVILTVWANNVSGDLSVQCTKAGLIPDNTDGVLQEIRNYSEGTYGTFGFSDNSSFSSAYSSCTYRFFKAGASSFTADDFTVTIADSSGNYVADKATP